MSADIAARVGVVGILGLSFLLGLAAASWLWFWHERGVRRRLDSLEGRLNTQNDTLGLEAKAIKKLDGRLDGLDSSARQMFRRLNALTDVVDEIRNGSFTMQWEKKDD